MSNLYITLNLSMLPKYKRAFFLLGILFLLCLAGYSQSSSSFDKQPIIAEAQRQLTIKATSTGELGEACTKNGVTGTFVVDITIQGKGKVLTVFMVSSDVEDIKDQNFLKNRITQVEFANIKIPKKERVKFRHTLTF